MCPAGATILVVDDEPTVLDTVRDGLTAHGYQVLKASGVRRRFRLSRVIKARSRWRSWTS
jgi:DNA-binding response OmpR family regulator